MSYQSSRLIHRAEAGFTLVELLVVLVILGLVATIAVPQVMKYVSSSRSKSARIQIERLSTVLDLFYLDIGRYPTPEEGLEALTERPPSIEAWAGPYIKSSDSIVDPWDRQYLYRIPGEHGEFDLYSLGADGREGGSGEDADIVSW